MTTQDAVKEKVEEMLSDLKPWMLEKVNHLFKSGAIDFEAESDSYSLPKLILCALAREMEVQYTPLSITKTEKTKIKRLYAHL